MGAVMRSKLHKKVPHDLILKYFCKRQYLNKDGVRVTTPSQQACYFHLNLDCARKVEPRMELTDIIIHSEIREFLTERYIQFLAQFGVKL
jgi:hypothetical protein